MEIANYDGYECRVANPYARRFGPRLRKINRTAPTEEEAAPRLAGAELSQSLPFRPMRQDPNAAQICGTHEKITDIQGLKPITPIMNANGIPHSSPGLAQPRVLHLLPGYSPELNPDEWVWRNLKSGVMEKLQHLTKQSMKMEAISHLRRLQKQPYIVGSFFHSETTRYAA